MLSPVRALGAQGGKGVQAQLPKPAKPKKSAGPIAKQSKANGLSLDNRLAQLPSKANGLSLDIGWPNCQAKQSEANGLSLDNRLAQLPRRANVWVTAF